MAKIENIKPNITLMRLKIRHPDLFYPQDWYEDEEFAHRSLDLGTHVIGGTGTGSPPAVAVVYYAITHWADHGTLAWPDTYVWTSDRDEHGDRVYVGGWALGKHPGLQIHRHLTLRNVIDIGYEWTT